MVLKLGRVQVRCLGYPTEDLNDILHQKICMGFHVMYHCDRLLIIRYGKHNSFLIEGTWVIGFFRDVK